MKLLSAVFSIAVASALTMSIQEAEAQKLVILHTNDTHSQIDPDDKDLGGVLRRKVLIDSVRAVERNVLLVDAGDAVQGTLYFTLYKGEVEQKMLNALGYDIQILGNHEFDNGTEALAKNYLQAKPLILSSNYDMVTMTELDTLVGQSAIMEYGDKRVGIIALNLDPAGMIADENARGVIFKDEIATGDSLARKLKEVDKADLVVALTHVGYDSATLPTVPDTEIAAKTRYIDIIIGGHSHTVINSTDPKAPVHKIPNLAGDTVLIAQTGKGGRYLGEVDYDFATHKATSRLILVDKRLDCRIDPRAAALIEPYRAGVDSLLAVKVGRTAKELVHGSPALLNWVSDFILWEGRQIARTPVDMAIMNGGGIRRGLPLGDITQGMIMMMLPFENKVHVIDIKGSDLAAALDVMASRGGDGVSDGVDIAFDRQTHRCSKIRIGGKPLDAQRTYRVATIDYLAHGGDYMTPLKKGKTVAVSSQRLDEALIGYLLSNDMKGKKVNPSSTVRMHGN